MEPFDPNFTPRPNPTRFSLPPKPRSSPLGLTIGILIILALLVAGGIALRLLSQQQQAPEPPQPSLPAASPRPADQPVKKPSLTASPAPAPTATPTIVPEPSIVATTTDPKSEEWDRVQETYRTATPQLGIVALADFIHNAPDSTFVPTAQSQIDEALDRLWWIRIKDLCAQRDTLSKQVTEIDKQIGIVRTNGAVAERIKELQAERDPIAKQLAAVQEHLDEMKFKAPASPDLYDEARLTQLRKARDAEAFATWKKSTAGYIKRNRGKLPW